MKNITQEMLETIIQKLQLSHQQPTPQKKLASGLGIPGIPIIAPIDATTLSLIGKLHSPPESPEEIEKLKSALTFISSDTSYGTGSFYSKCNGSPEPDCWLAGIWAIASMNWLSGKDIARKWSEQSDRFTEDGFEKAWNSFNPRHANGIGIGSLYKRAKELGWKYDSTYPESTNLIEATQRFRLLGIDDLAALPPVDYLIKGVLPGSGIAAIFGPSGSGKTFVALDLLMAVACQLHTSDLRVKAGLVIASKHGS